MTMSRAAALWRCLSFALTVLAIVTLRTNALAAAPEQPEQAGLSGRVIEAGGSRIGVAGAVVMIVDAPANVVPGKRAREPLDPAAITWTRRAETDADGNFAIAEIPVGKARVVIVAGGYARLEQWAEIHANTDRNQLDLYVRPEAGEYRTVVRSERPSQYAVEPEHVIDGQEARHYAGSGDDPLLAAQNLPGIARSPVGFGMLGFRGGDPNETGVYLDGHPVPRAFHVVPIASVLPAQMIGRVQMSPGNYGAAFGGYGGGLVEIESRPGGRDGVHGQAHIDLYDFGSTVEGAVGDGSVHVGIRRSHIGEILGRIDNLPVPVPDFWDYLARFDYPVRPGHDLTVRALGAGDRLTEADVLDFGASFHRFDLEYRRTTDDWRVLLSPSLRLDSSKLHQGVVGLRRRAQVYSFRLAFTRRNLAPWLKLEFGTDVVAERWRRRDSVDSYMSYGGPVEATSEDSNGNQLRAGVWLSAPLEFGAWRLTPSLRANLFAYTDYPTLRLDPRVDLRGRVHPRIELFAALGMYSRPVVVARAEDSDLIEQGGFLGDGVANVPSYLIEYFEPGVDTDVDSRSATATYVIHASAGMQVSLPWDVEARATGFWREGLPTTVDRSAPAEPHYFGRRRSMGLELLLRRSLASGVLDGWIGYTLMWARVGQKDGTWLPAVFDQRHNFVALLSTELPKGFRLGLRFRVGSGNPQTPVVGREIFAQAGQWYYRPLRAPRGTTYQPLFHQLDLRIDKRWTRDRTSVTAYLDVQNVYNQIYPEIWIYTTDWSDRRSLLGLPIYPSLGVQVDF